MTSKDKIVSSLEFEKDPDDELPLPKIPRNKGKEVVGTPSNPSLV